MDRAELEAFIAAQRRDFQSTLAARMEELEAFWARGDPEARAGLHRIAHRLAGTAGTFGFGALSRCAALLEDTLDQGPPEGDIRASLQAPYEALRAELERAASGVT